SHSVGLRNVPRMPMRTSPEILILTIAAVSIFTACTREQGGFFADAAHSSIGQDAQPGAVLDSGSGAGKDAGNRAATGGSVIQDSGSFDFDSGPTVNDSGPPPFDSGSSG